MSKSIHQPATPGILDVGELAKIVGDDRELLSLTVEKYRKTLADHCVQINQAYENLDKESIRVLTHRLKSASRIMGAFDLANCCEKIERSSGILDASSAENSKLELNKLVDAVNEAIDKYLAGNNIDSAHG